MALFTLKGEAVAIARADMTSQEMLGRQDGHRGYDRKGNNGAGHLSKGVEAGRERDGPSTRKQ